MQLIYDFKTQTWMLSTQLAPNQLGMQLTWGPLLWGKKSPGLCNLELKQLDLPEVIVQWVL